MGEYTRKLQKSESERKQFLRGQIKETKRKNAVPKLIPHAIAQEFEQKTGYSSTNIRVSESDMPDLFGAKAATQGNEIHFPRGQYQPETAEGKRILKHEMRHTIQQARNEVAPNVDGVVNDEKGKEAEADKGFEQIKESNGNTGKFILAQSNYLPVQCSGRGRGGQGIQRNRGGQGIQGGRGVQAAQPVSPSLQAAENELQHLPNLAMRPAGDIENELQAGGYTGVPANSGGRVYTRDLGNGYTIAVRLDPAVRRSPPRNYADEVNHAHIEIVETQHVNAGNYSPGTARTYDRNGQFTQDRSQTHIPLA